MLGALQRRVSEAQRILEEYLQPRPQNNERRILDQFGGGFSERARFGSRCRSIAAATKQSSLEVCLQLWTRQFASYRLRRVS